MVLLVFVKQHWILGASLFAIFALTALMLRKLHRDDERRVARTALLYLLDRSHAMCLRDLVVIFLKHYGRPDLVCDLLTHAIDHEIRDQCVTWNDDGSLSITKGGQEMIRANIFRTFYLDFRLMPSFFGDIPLADLETTRDESRAN